MADLKLDMAQIQSEFEKIVSSYSELVQVITDLEEARKLLDDSKSNEFIEAIQEKLSEVTSGLSEACEGAMSDQIEQIQTNITAFQENEASIVAGGV